MTHSTYGYIAHKYGGDIMVGIYKITNKINEHCYIGQSRNIAKRWRAHKESMSNKNTPAYDYPLQRALRKYGVDSFIFEVIEECSVSELNEREIYWISFYNPEYNQTAGGNYTIVPQKLTPEQVEKIQQILLEDTAGEVSHAELAKQYGVNKDTIKDINVGRTWYNDKYVYPLHYSKFDCNKPTNKINKCIDCGIEIVKGSIRCIKCHSLFSRKIVRPSREELKALIRTTSFCQIGAMYGVTDNAIRKWCKAEGLPSKATEIKKYTDFEWLNI